ncbi:MAG: hypothetical protein AB1465_01990 [Patescibacteria group bacterium]
MAIDIEDRIDEAKRLLAPVITKGLVFPVFDFSNEEVIQLINWGHDEFEMIPGGLDINDLEKLGKVYLRMDKEKDLTKYRRLTTRAKWTFGLTRMRKDAPSLALDDQEKLTRACFTSFEFKALTRPPKTPQEWERMLETCYLFFVKRFRSGGTLGKFLTMLSINPLDLRNPTKNPLPCVLVLSDEEDSLHIGIFDPEQKIEAQQDITNK